MNEEILKTHKVTFIPCGDALEKIEELNKSLPAAPEKEIETDKNDSIS